MTYKHDDVILYPMDLYFEGKKKINIHSMKPCVEEMDTPLGLFMAHIKIKQDSRMHLLSRMQSAVEPAAIDNGINARQYHT